MICGRVKTDTGDHEQQAGPYRFQEVDRPDERANVPRFDPPPFLGGVVLKPLSSGSRFQENGIYRKTRID